MITLGRWQEAQEWELAWHGNCINSFHEEQKQLVYAEKMGLIRTPTPKTPYNFDLEGRSILDIGGGAYSLLLKCTNFTDSVVADPLMETYPDWVRERYRSMGISPQGIMGEYIADYSLRVFDEVWIYNVLEHTKNPKKLVENALELGKVVRIFEWVETPPNIGHPHTLTKRKLDKWLGGEGIVSKVDHDGAVGKAYSGVFKGKYYETTSSNN